ncbi:hemagglutinin/amebocyte aggregation factor-like [Dendronephthya gigantea]|uniref:hemagglutinin/amebocyte aggregation factor-like n=1 Tax=Dendronephthya gigantea TaxID=151771 RepID=UPI00106BFE0F|nr:hemagglutinin/amebocyte aggregation factor-like [Dendronephthya gigantea]
MMEGTANYSMFINAGTKFDAAWSSDCPSGQSIRHISSVHSNWHEDRSWTWSGYVNSFDQDLLYQCATGVAGARSYHSNCYWTGYVNSWDGYLSYTVPSYYYPVGVQSYHTQQF